MNHLRSFLAVSLAGLFATGCSTSAALRTPPPARFTPSSPTELRAEALAEPHLFDLATGQSVLPSSARDFALGVEVQAYPAGVIPGLHAEWRLSERSVLTARLAANVTDRRDWGEQDDEEGDGFGGGVGYRYFFGDDLDGWLVGARVDLWDLEIDWRDDNPAAEGTTDLIVLQPTVEAGYAWRLPDSRWRIDATVSLGAEINVDEDGRDVGEGAIVLGGLTATYGF